MANQPKKYTKFVATAATATLVASAIVPVASAASFSDVAETNSHAENINALVEAGIIKGFEDGTFKPGQELTRGQVVKMLGKWVEAQGVEIPADYATKARFTDVAVDAKDQELVKYAALVADAKVFNGSNGVLNASGKISRENMALVLDRAYTAINKTSLVALASTIEDVKVADLATAKKEAQEAIQALRDLGITVVDNFNPKASVTRGQFASFLNKTINTKATPVELTVKSAVATSATTLDVVLSDESKHVVTLDKALEANKATEVTFKIGENEFKATVTFVVPDFAVASAKAINSKEILVTFNKEINKASLANDGIFNVTVNNGKAEAIKAAKVALQDDKKSVIISLATELVNKDTYKVDVAKATLLSADYQEVVKFAGESTIFTDAVAPTLVSFTYNGSEVEFTFNKPLNIKNETTKVNGQKVTLVNASTAGKYVYKAKIKLAVGEHTFVITGLEDTVGNAAGTVTGKVTVSNDTTAPTLVSSEAISKDTFELQFSEKLSTLGDVVVKKGSQVLDVKKSFKDDSDNKVVVVKVESTDKVKNPLYLEDETSIALSYEVTGYKDMATLIGNKATGSVTLTTDEVGPAVLAKNLNKFAKNAYTVVLDETVKTLDASKLTVKKSGILQPKAVDTTKSVITGTDKDQVEVNFASTLAEGTYTVTFAAGALKDAEGNSNKEFTLEFVVGEAKEFFVLSGTKVTANKDQANSFIVNYGTEVTDSALTEANYKLDGSALPTGSTVEYYVNEKQVLVTLPASYAVKTTAPYTLEISKAVTTKAGAAVVADAEGKKAFTQKIELTDNVAPVLESAELLYVKDATTSNTVELTFSEAITDADLDDLVVNIAGVEAKFTAKATDKVITITLKEAVNVAQDVTVTIVAEGKNNTELAIKDAKGNKVTASSLKATPVVTK